MTKILTIIALFSFASCASRPQLYPNEKLKTVGKQAAKKDIDRCMAEAEDYVESSKGKK
jgi:hypothetical protein